MPDDKILTIRKGNPVGIKDRIDIRVFYNNYIGFHFTICGYGIWFAFKVQRKKKDYESMKK